MTGRLAHIYRHPIKGHGREALASVRLSTGACLPFDRHWAVAHEAARLEPGWNPCVNFARGAKAPELMAISARLDEASGQVTLSHPARPDITFRPDDTADLPRFLAWLRPLSPADRAQPQQIVTAGRGMTDSEFPSVSILSLTSLADLEQRMSQPLSPHRWRGNFWLAGATPWAEFDWIGRHIRIGGSLLKIEERITRCKATSVNPESGKIDADTLGALDRNFGHRDFGIYATVVEDGPVAIDDEWSVV